MSRKKDDGPPQRRQFVKTFVSFSAIFPKVLPRWQQSLKEIAMRGFAGYVGWVGFGILGLAGNVFGEEPKSNPPATLNELSMEVSALQILHHLNVTTPQLTALRKIAKETASKTQDAKPGKGSDKLRAALMEMHKALLDKKEDKVDSLAEKLNGLRDEEKPELEDVDLTETARRRAPEALRRLGAPQVAGYLAGLADDIDDPHSRLLTALTEVRGLSADKWKEFRADFGDEIARLVVGVDSDKAEKVSDEVIQLLIVARSLPEADFKTQLPDLEKTAHKIVGDLGPFQVLQNVMENVMAALLSNPRLVAAIDARLQKGEKEAIPSPARERKSPESARKD